MAKMNRYEYIKMMRENQHTKEREERLDLKNEYGIKDPVPQMAVDEIRAAE